MCVVQKHIPDDVWAAAGRSLPGTQPLSFDNWLRVDDAFAGQMAFRDKLITGQAGDVHQMLPEAIGAASECFELIVGLLRQHPAYDVGAETIRRPDGVEVPIDRALPLSTIGRLVQEDVCLMQPGPDGHVLTGAVLCFPASWTLCEKIGKPLLGIHRPVTRYDAGIAKRVQRLFDALRPDQPLWRANALLYEKPELFTPRSESDDTPHFSGKGRYIRSERQVFVRLPQTRAIVFSIHTYLVERSSLTARQVMNLPDIEAKSNER